MPNWPHPHFHAIYKGCSNKFNFITNIQLLFNNDSYIPKILLLGGSIIGGADN